MSATQIVEILLYLRVKLNIYVLEDAMEVDEPRVKSSNDVPELPPKPKPGIWTDLFHVYFYTMKMF